MTHHDDAHGDAADEPRTDERYVGIETTEGYLVYDASREGAWIESDTALAIDDAV